MKLLAAKLESKIPVISLIVSIIVAWLVVPAVSGFPLVTFSIFFICLGTLVFMVRKEKTWFDSSLYISILFLSFFIIYRANGFLQFLDFLFIIFFGSLLIVPLLSAHGLFEIVLSPLVAIANALTAKNIYPLKFTIPTKYKEVKYLSKYLPTILVTILIVLITVPLLASANPFFNNLVQHVLKILDLDWLLKYIFADAFSVYIFRGVVLMFLIYFIPRVLTVAVIGAKGLKIKQYFTIDYLVPKATMAGLLIIFFITQLQLYFASSEALWNMGYTNSRLTNEVFAQVTIVAFIVFLLAYFDKSRNLWNKRLSYFLIVEAFFLIGIAFKSVYDYTAIWGLTQKRLWGYASMTWLSGALAFFVYHYTKLTPNISFVKQVLTYTMAILILINVLNFDYIIYHSAKPSTPTGVDYGYLARLSPDARQYSEVLTKLITDFETSGAISDEKAYTLYSLLSKIDFLQYKYGIRKEVNTFNITEYQEYLTIKDTNTEEYRKRITDKQQGPSPRSPFPTPQP